MEASANLRNDLLAHIFRLSYSDIDAVGTSTLITRMTSDVNQVQTGINMVLRLFLRSPFVVFGAMIMAFTVDVKAAMVFVAVIPLLSVVVFGIMLISMPLYKKVQKQLDRVMLATRENLLGVRVIRAFNRQKGETVRFEEENGILVRLQVFVGKISALLNPVTYIMINLATVAVIWTGALQVDAGLLTQGKVVALVNYMSQILVELIKLANLIIIISKSVACMNRVDSVFEIEPGIRDEHGAAMGGTDSGASLADLKTDMAGVREAAQRLLWSFGMCHFLCRGQGAVSVPDFFFCEKRRDRGCYRRNWFRKIHPGESDSEVLRCGFRPGAGGRHGCKRYISFKPAGKDRVVPQKAVLFKGTLRENMLWGREDATDEEIYQALDIAQAREFVEDKGQGLELPIAQTEEICQAGSGSV